jgi:lipopolysaccharide/colanic/teichoic acid biosynthesis glycosyltransferase
MRLLDVTGALIALIVLAPLFALAALLILLTDGRPILFRHGRVGRDGEPFLILKFRTMRSGSDGLAITTSNDGRVTKAGAWLRRLKIDELPQLVNVLRGEMSLIGPRPEAPEYVEFGDGRWRKVLAVRPGITDLATLAFRNEEEILGPASDPDAYYRSVITNAVARFQAPVDDRPIQLLSPRLRPRSSHAVSGGLAGNRSLGRGSVS